MKLSEKTIKISVFLATSGHSGVDRISKNLISHLAQMGYKVDLLKIKDHGPYLKEAHDNVRVLEFNTSHVYSSFFKLTNYLKSNTPHILFTDKDRVNRLAILCKLLFKIPTKVFVRIGTTVSINLNSRGFLDRLIQRNSIGRLYKYADKVLVPSMGVKEDITRYTGLNPKYISVVPSPVIDDSMINNINTLPIPDHPWYKNKRCPIIIGVGELCMRKDFPTLIKSFKIVKDVFDSRLIILGKGKKIESLKRLALELDIERFVDFLGFKDDPYPYMAHADVFVLSSLWEGLPVSLIEALALGTPAISTDCPSGSREILQNGKYGPLVPLRDYKNMAEAIIEVIKNPLPANFLKKAARPYTIKNATDAYLKAFGLIDN